MMNMLIIPIGMIIGLWLYIYLKMNKMKNLIKYLYQSYISYKYELQNIIYTKEYCKLTLTTKKEES